MTLFPLAVAYALLQHNILETRAYPMRRLFALPCGLLGCGAGGSTYFWMSVTLPSSLSGLYALLAAAGATLASWGLVDRFAFRSSRRYRPSIERLKDQLARETDAASLERSLGGSRKARLDVEGVRVLRPGTESFWRR